MRPVSSQYLAAILRPHRRLAEVTIMLPGESTGTPVDIDTEDCTVTMSGDGARYSASISLSPDVNRDVYDLAATPGAAFAIRSGLAYGGDHEEWIDLGVHYAVGGSLALAAGDLPLTLQDGSTRLEECRFEEPWSVTGGGYRSAAIAAMVTDAWADVTVVQEATGGLMSDAVYERDRLPAIADIASGGTLDAAFDAVGEFVIRNQPLITPTVPAWVATTGEHGVILPDAERTISLNRLYNMVIVLAPEPFQTWGAIKYQIADPAHPRHYSKIGKRPYFVTDPSITSAAQARQVGQATLTRLLTIVEEIAIPALGNPALEYGDTLAVAHQATAADRGLRANYLTTGWTFNLGTGAMDITGRSTDQPELEEAA